jgi:hypothetical protein
VNMQERYYIRGTVAVVLMVAGILAFSVMDARKPDTMTPQQIKAAAQTAREAGHYPTTTH